MPIEHSPAKTSQNMDTTLSSSSVNEQTPRFLQGNEINRIGLRIPEFTPADPELWFSIMDRSFQAAGITTDSTKFGYALTAIGPRYTLEVRDIIMYPPSENAYQTLRTELRASRELAYRKNTKLGNSWSMKKSETGNLLNS